MKKLTECFLKRNIILFRGMIDDQKVAEIEKTFSELYLDGSPDVIVLITSPGGSIDKGFCIFDLLKLYPGKKTAIVCEKACSMAAIILQACDERYATFHARILIHHGSQNVTFDEMKNNKKLQEIIKDHEKKIEKMYQVVAKRSGKSLEEVKKQFTKDQYMDATEAISFGLLDGIWDKPLPK